MRAFLIAAALLLLATAAPMVSAAPALPSGGDGGCGAPYLDSNSLQHDSWTVGFCTFTFSGIVPDGSGWTGITSSVAA